MTPFGRRIRGLRVARGVALKAMAQELGVSPAYLSALEHGHRGRPTYVLVMQICGYFQLIWDEAEELHRLARLSHPRVVIDTAGASAEATLLANVLAERIHDLDPATIRRILAELRRPPEDMAPEDMSGEKAEEQSPPAASPSSPEPAGSPRLAHLKIPQ